VYPTSVVGDRVQWGTNEMVPVTMSGLARVDQTETRCQVGVEWVASNLAWALGLPVPPGGLADVDGQLGYVMLQFGAGGISPPVDCGDFMARHPKVASGAIVFDLWIANSDRTEFNLAEDGRQRRPVLFDHEKAFGGGYTDRLSSLIARVGDLNVHEVHDCDLNSTAHRSDLLAPWVDRIDRLDHEAIRRPCTDLTNIGYWSAADGGTVADFLIERRNHLWKLLKDTCSGVGAWPL
jgi:hypothetical protein